MIPAYITFVADKDRNDANIMNIADDIEMSSINGNNDDEYLHYDNKDCLNQNIIIDAITNLDTDEDDDDDTMETIIRFPEYNYESSRMMTMTTDDFGLGDTAKKDDYCYINTNLNTNNGSNYNYKSNCISNYIRNSNSNSNSNINYNCNTKINTNINTNIISYECGSLFEDYDDDIMFPSDTIITLD